MKKTLFLFSFILLSLLVSAQPRITILESGRKVSLRGLSVVTNKVVWASGSNGSVARSTNGGKTWKWITVQGYEKRDFRDIEAFDDKTAVIIGVGEPAIILKTEDGGESWMKVLEDSTKGMFLDAMVFNNYGGWVIGDPVNGRMYQAFTDNKGMAWRASFGEFLHKGEAFFASSGTNIVMFGGHPMMVTGGTHSRFYDALQWYELPIIHGKESTGANSIAMWDQHKGVIVGGDFANDTLTTNNCVLVRLQAHGLEPVFAKPVIAPHGYRSCVAYVTEKKLITCGTSGVDISKDGGRNWKLIAKDSYHVCQKAKKGKAVFMAGNGGRIARVYGL